MKQLDMDTGTAKDMAVVSMQIAYENLVDGCALLHHNRARAAANRLYYAVYRAIAAVHALDGNSYRKHKDALGQFNKLYLKDEIFSRKYGEMLYHLQQVRHISDYDMREPDIDELKSYAVCAKAFCDELRLYCEKKLFCNIDVEIPVVEI